MDTLLEDLETEFSQIRFLRKFESCFTFTTGIAKEFINVCNVRNVKQYSFPYMHPHVPLQGQLHVYKI